MAIKARAQQNLTKVFDGSGVFSIILTNENTSIPISNQGLALNYTATPSDVYVYSGTSLLTPVASNPEPGEYTLTASGENITAGVISYNDNHASIGNASDFVTDKQTYSITFTASGKDFLGNPFTAQKKQVITALRHGDDATSYWLNTTASVVMKDVNNVLQPSNLTVSAVSQEGFANATPYKGIFKIYIKTGVAFPTTPAYTSPAPEVSHTVNLDTTMNDIRIDMYSADGSSLLDTQTVPVIAQANGVISTSIQYTVTDKNVQPTESASWSDTIPTVGIGQFLWTKTTFYYTDGSNAVAYSMGHVGKDGASAPLLFLSSDSQAFTFDGAGNPSPANQTINFVANLQNMTGTATFVATPYLNGAAGTPIALGGTGNARSLTVAQFGKVYDSVSVKASLGNLSDTETVYKLKDGSQGAQGVPGPKGPDGLTTYVHIAYANSADGATNFSTTDPTDRAYIGVYTDTSVPDSTDYTKYTWSLIKGADGADGTPGPKGADGRTSYIHVAYANSADGSTSFSVTDPTGKAYIGVYTDFTLADSTDYTKYTWSLVKGADGANGAQGVPGPKGADGLTTYIHFAYANSANGSSNFSTTDPTDRAYIGVYTDTSVPDSTDYTKYTWSLIKGPQGNTGPTGATGAPGPKGADGLTTYVHIAYANSADGSSNFSTTEPVGRAYIGVLTDTYVPDSTDYTRYTWSLIKGADGANGAQGVPGPKGADGISTYIHFAYANSANGATNFSTTDPTGKAYIGVYTDTAVPDSTDYTKYTWSLIKGADGANGTPGPKGADGNTSYIHIAYANSSNGSNNFSTTDPTGRAYIGVYTDFTLADSTDYTKYTWSLVKGADGANGAQGVPGPKGADGLTTYVHFVYAGNATGTLNFSTTDPSGRSYMGVMTDTTPADSTDPTKYTWSLIQGPQGTVGPTGATGAPGPKGADGLTTYVHIAYANSADGATNFSTTDPTGKAYIGVLTDTSVPDSTDYTRYTWSLIKGADGANGAQGVPGPKGADGISTYIHFAYANSANGATNFSTTDPTDKAYIGVYTDTAVPDSTDYTKYSWSLIKGPQGPTGPQGIPGPTGPNGISTYVHFAYANSSDGTVGFSTTANNQTYIGVYTDNTQSSSTTPSKYTWSLMKGADGKNAITGWLTNEAITLQADSNGNVPSYTSATGSFVVYNGLTQVTGLTVSQANAVGMSLNISGMNYNVTNMIADIAYVDLSVTYSGTTITKRLTLAKSKAGANGANGTSVVNSTTPPANPTAGQWWNDMSVTPNVLKVYQSGNWIPYRIDAINLVAQSVTTDKLATNVLVASNVTYTNKNGTSTNLQTFNFDGIQTLLSDGNGNVYSSMDNAVSSTQTWKGLNTKVNSLGQINQIVNSEFTPDMSGWYDRGVSVTQVLAPAYGTPINGSNVYAPSPIPFSRLQSAPIAVTPGMVVSYSMVKTGTYWSYLNASDAKGNIINVPGTNSNEIVGSDIYSTSYTKVENITIPAGVNYVSLGVWYSQFTAISQPMLVFSATVGTYVAGNYNNNQSVANIKAQADKIELNVSNMSVGGRNLVLGTATDTAWTADSANNYSFKVIKTGLKPGQTYTFSAEVTLGNTDQKIVTVSLFNEPIGQYLASNDNFKADGTRDHWTFTVPTTVNTPTASLIIYAGTTGSTGGKSATYHHIKLETGNMPTDWAEAPEDVTTWVQSQIKLTADQINIGVSSAQSTADAATNKVNNLSVGGTNLFLGTKGFTDPLGTNPWLFGGGYTFTTDGPRGLTSHNNAGAWGGPKYNIVDLEKRGLINTTDTYTLSAWVRQTNTSGPLTIMAYGDAVTWVSNQQVAIVRSGDGWVRVSAQLKFQKATGNTGKLRFEPTAGEPGGVAYLQQAGLKLEKGNLTTDWSPAPEDVPQVNQAYNTEFTSNTDGWDRSPYMILDTSTGTVTYNRTDLTGTSTSWQNMRQIDSLVMPVKAGDPVSASIFVVSSAATGSLPTSTMTYMTVEFTKLDGSVQQNFTKDISNLTNTRVLNSNIIAPTGAVSARLKIETNGNTSFSFKQPMLVKSYTVGDYTPGFSYSGIQGGRNYVLSSSGTNALPSSVPTLSGATPYSNAQMTYQPDGITLTNETTNKTQERFFQVAGAWTSINNVPLNPGQTFTYSADVMGTVPQAVLRWGFQGTGGYESFQAFKITNPTTWQRISTTITVPTGATSIYLRLQLGINGQYQTGWAGGETLRFRNVKVEDGSVATAWSPAPEDLVTTANSASYRYLRFNGQGNNVNSNTHFTQIEALTNRGVNIMSGLSATIWGSGTGSILNNSNGKATNGVFNDNTNFMDLSGFINQNQFAVYDLGSQRFDLDKLRMTMWGPDRTYYGVLAQASADGVNWTTIFKGNIDNTTLYNGIVSATVSFGTSLAPVQAAQSTATTANSTANSAQATAKAVTDKVNSLSVGGRNLLLDTATRAAVGPNASNNTPDAFRWTLAGGIKVGDLYTAWGNNAPISLSFDWAITGTTISGAFNPQWSSAPWGIGTTGAPGITVSSTNTSGHYTWSSTTQPGWSGSTANMFTFRTDNLQGTLKITNLKFEQGNLPTAWSPSPEDVDASIGAVKKISSDLKLKVDSYSLGTTVDGKLVSGFTGNQQQVTIKGNMVTLDSDTVVTKDFIAKNIKTDNLSSISATLGDVTSGSITNLISGARTGHSDSTLSGKTVIDKNGIDMQADVLVSGTKMFSEQLRFSPDTGILFKWLNQQGGVIRNTTIDDLGVTVSSGGAYSAGFSEMGLGIEGPNGAVGQLGVGGAYSTEFQTFTKSFTGQNLEVKLNFYRQGNVVMVNLNMVTYGPTLQGDAALMYGGKIPVGYRPIFPVDMVVNANSSGGSQSGMVISLDTTGDVYKTGPAWGGVMRVMAHTAYLTASVGPSTTNNNQRSDGYGNINP